MGFISDMFWAPWIGFYADTTATLPCVIVHVIGLVLQKQFNQLCPCCLHLVGFLGFVVRTVWPPGLGITRPNWSTPDSKAHGTNLGPVGPRWTPCWPHEPCYQGHTVHTALGPAAITVQQPSQFSSQLLAPDFLLHCWLWEIFQDGAQCWKKI